MDINYMDLKERISQKMKDVNISSRAELAKEIGIGVSTLENNLKGATSMSVETLTKIASRLNVSIDWLLFGDIANSNTHENNVEYLIHCINVLLKAFEKNMTIENVEYYTSDDLFKNSYMAFVIKDDRISDYIKNYKESEPTRRNLELINQSELYNEILKKFINAHELKIKDGHLYNPENEMVITINGDTQTIQAEKRGDKMVPLNSDIEFNDAMQAWSYKHNNDLPY